jgi:hypothetical protein
MVRAKETTDSLKLIKLKEPLSGRIRRQLVDDGQPHELIIFIGQFQHLAQGFQLPLR